MTPGCNRRIASIVCTILAISSLFGAVTDVNISSPRGTTNIIRNIITNSVGSGKLLLVQGTNILGISTNNFGPSNAITSVIINFSGPGVGGTVINPIFADSTNALWALDGSFTDVHLHFTNISEKQLLFSDTITNNASTTKHGFLQKLSGNTNSVFKGDGNESTNLYGIGTINANNGGFTNSLLFNGVQVLTNIPAVGSTNTLTKWLTSNSLSYIVNLSGILTNDGAGNFGYTTNIGGLGTLNANNGSFTNSLKLNGVDVVTNATGYRTLLSETNTWLGTNNFTGFLRKDGINVLTNIPASGSANTLVIWLTTNSQSYIINGVGMLTNDGNGNFGYTTNLSQDITFNNITINSNLTVNTLTVNSNLTIAYTLTTSNAFFISGKGNTVIITNSLQLLSLSNSVLMVTSTGVATNVTLGTGLTLTGQTLFPTNIVENQLNLTDLTTGDASTSKHGFLPKLTNDVTKFLNGIGTYTVPSGGGSSSGSTNYRSSIITLTMTTTNVDANQIDWAKTNVAYKLILTTNAFFSDIVCSNVPDTNSFQWLQLHIIQDGTGSRTVTFTNSIFAGVNGTFALTATANAWDTFTLINSPQTNGNVAVLPVNYLRR